MLRCHNRYTLGYELKKNWMRNLSLQSQQLIRESGLWQVPFCVFESLDWPLITAFVERWHPETNSFHLPFGEMTIMLHDVYQILGLHTEGSPVVKVVDSKALPQWTSSILQLLNTTSLTGTDMTNTAVRCKTILDRCRKVDRDEDTQVAAILSLIGGGLLFTDKSSSRMQKHDFIFADQIATQSGVSWGSATLAYLYRQLGMASRAETSQIGGCLTLLQAWIYEYFPMFRPHRDRLMLDSGTPHAMMWNVSSEPKGKDELRLAGLRPKIDLLTATSVCLI